MRTSTQSITIMAAPDDVFGFVADLERLPTWAIGFAKGIRLDNGSWLVRTASGDEFPIRVETDAAHGTVDYFMSPAQGVELSAMSRVIGNGDGAEYVFTMFQPPEMPDHVFETQIGELARELVVLKAHMESNCPL